MQSHPNHNGNGHDPKQGMAFVLALIAVFFGAPELYHRTIGFVMAFSQARYGADFTDLVILAWAVIVAAFTFYAARITFDLALASALLALAMRFF